MTTPWKHWEIEEKTSECVTVWADVADQSQNTFSKAVMSELEEVISDLESRSGLKTVFIRSRKPTSFFAGADIHEFLEIQDTEQARAISRRGQEVFARLEKLPATTIAVIRGACLGGGLEMSLACDYRLAVDDSSTRLGQPETELGILPGWGGTQRLPQTVSLLDAIGMILQSKKMNAGKARKIGLVDRVVSDEELEQVLDEVAKSPETLESKPSRTWTGWFLNKTSFGRNLVFGATEKRISRQKQHYPALEKSLEAIKLSFEPQPKGYEFEQDAIAELFFTPTCHNLVGLFLNREKARNLSTWEIPEEIKDQEVNTLAVLGGGTMGSGIAHAGIKNGLNVVLREINEEALQAAKKRVAKTYDTLLGRKSLTNEEAREQQQKLTYTTSLDELNDAEVVIEAVPESLELKQKVFGETTEQCPESTVLATNTSALSIDEIFASVPHPERVGGLHFFNPVHRMDLVEVVSGKETSTATIGRLLKLARQLGKTPIVTTNSPGFAVNRILMPYLDEAVKTAIEFTSRSADLSRIDKEMKAFGMPMGPLELIDQVGVDVAAHVANSMTIVFGDKSDTATVLNRMVEQKRLGRKTEAGFYNYVKGKKSSAIGLQPLVQDINIDLEEPEETRLTETLTAIQQRLVLAMINEAGRCLDEGVVKEAWMIDLAMVLGTGFAPFRGGPLQFAKQLKPEELTDAFEKLEKVYGDRYAISPALKAWISR